MTSQSSRANIFDGDINCGRGQFGQTTQITTGTNIVHGSRFYNKYLVTPTAAIQFQLATIGSLAANVQIGHELLIVNAGATFNIDVTAGATVVILRPGTYCELIATAVGVWTVKQSTSNASKIASGNGAPTALASDSSGDLYIDRTTPALYQYNGIAWSVFGSSGVSVDADSISGAGTVPNPYYTSSVLTTLTSAEANLRDKLVTVDSAGLLVSAEKYCVTGIVGKDSAHQSIDRGITGDLSSGMSETPTMIYCHDCNAIYKMVTTFSVGVVTAGVGVDGRTYSYTPPTTFSALLVKLDLSGNLLFAVRVIGNGASNVIAGGMYHDEINHVTWFGGEHGTGTCELYDFNNFNGDPVVQFPYSGSPRANFWLAPVDDRGIYMGSKVAPIVLTGNQVTCRKIIGDTDGNLYIVTPIMAGSAVTFNQFSATPPAYVVTPPGTPNGGASNYVQFAVSKYNTTTSLFEFTITCEGVNNNTSNIQGQQGIGITEDGILLVSGTYNGSGIKTCRVFYNDGTVVAATVTLPTATYGVFYAGINRFSGLPIWVNSIAGGAGFGINETNPAVNSEYHTVDVIPYRNSLVLSSPARPVRVLATLTALSTSITSSAAFAATMNDAHIEGFGIPPGTKFTYVNASSGTLSAPATASGGELIYITNATSGSSTITVGTTNGSTAITSAALFTQLMSGMYVSGTGIPAGSQFRFIDTSNGFISRPATATGAPSATFSTTFSTITSVGDGVALIASNYDGDWVYGANIATGTTHSGTIRPDVFGFVNFDQYNNILLTFILTGATSLTFTNGATATVGNFQYIVRCDINGSLQSVREFAVNGFIGKLITIGGDIYASLRTGAASTSIDGITLASNGASIGNFIIKINPRWETSLGVAITNVAAGNPVKVVLSGRIATAVALTTGRFYYCSPIDASLVVDSEPALYLVGKAISTGALLR